MTIKPCKKCGNIPETAVKADAARHNFIIFTYAVSAGFCHGCLPVARPLRSLEYFEMKKEEDALIEAWNKQNECMQENNSAKKFKYKYFISFSHRRGNWVDFGNTILKTDNKIETVEQLKQIADEIAETSEAKGVIIINFQLLKED